MEKLYNRMLREIYESNQPMVQTKDLEKVLRRKRNTVHNVGNLLVRWGLVKKIDKLKIKSNGEPGRDVITFWAVKDKEKAKQQLIRSAERQNAIEN